MEAPPHDDLLGGGPPSVSKLLVGVCGSPVQGQSLWRSTPNPPSMGLWTTLVEAPLRRCAGRRPRPANERFRRASVESPPHSGVPVGGPRSAGFWVAPVEAPPHDDVSVAAPAQRLRVLDGVRRGEAPVSARSGAAALEYPPPMLPALPSPRSRGPVSARPVGFGCAASLELPVRGWVFPRARSRPWRPSGVVSGCAAGVPRTLLACPAVPTSV